MLALYSNARTEPGHPYTDAQNYASIIYKSLPAMEVGTEIGPCPSLFTPDTVTVILLSSSVEEEEHGDVVIDTFSLCSHTSLTHDEVGIVAETQTTPEPVSV